MEFGSGRLLLCKAGIYKTGGPGQEDLWFKTLYWNERTRLLQVNIEAYTYIDGLYPHDETEDCLELDLRRTTNPSLRLQILCKEIEKNISQVKFVDEPQVTLIDVKTLYTPEGEDRLLVDVCVSPEEEEKRIYPTLNYIESSDRERQVEFQDLLFEKNLRNFAMLVSVRDQVVIGKETWAPGMLFVLKIVENQDQKEDEAMEESNFNFSKFKSERHALIQHSGDDHVVRFVADVVDQKEVHENEVFGYLMEYVENGSLLDYLTIERLVTDDMRKKWVKQLFDGLASLHDKNYVVVTIHPSTCLIDGNENLKIAGLGRKRMKIDMPLPEALSDALKQGKDLVPRATKKTDLFMAGTLAYMILSKSTILRLPENGGMADIEYCSKTPLWKICIIRCISDQSISAGTCAKILKIG